MYRGFVHYWQTEYQATEARNGEAAAAAAAGDVGDGFYALAARMFFGLSRVHLGRISEALEDFRDAKAQARRNDDRYWLPRIVSHLGWVHREMGALERAREWDTQALALARERRLGPGARGAPEPVRRRRAAGPRRRRPPLSSPSSRRRRRSTSWMRWISDLRLAVAAAEHWMARGDCDRADEHAPSGSPPSPTASARATTGARPSGCAPSVALARGEGLEAAARAAGRHARRR